jgi:hypothetical protein
LIQKNPELTVYQILELMAQALSDTIVCNWMEVAEIHILYVAKSHGEKGNLCHIHCLLWVDDADVDEIVDKGYYKSFDHILKI